MNLRYIRFYFVLLVSLTLISGCDFLPEPSSLIQVPKTVKSPQGHSIDFRSIANRNLPRGTELTIPNGPVGVDPVIYSDFDGDGKGEILVFYHSLTNQKQVGTFLLKKQKNNWEKVFAKIGSGKEINWAYSADVTGDGKDEILLGWESGLTLGNILEVYTWKKGKLVRLKELQYHEIEAIQFENDQKTRLALWNRDLADVYKIQLLVWDGKDFVSDIAHYPSYYQKVVDYYSSRTKEVPDAAYYWYYLADAYYKANHPELALDAINRGMNLKSVMPSLGHFQELKDDIEIRNEALKTKPVRFEITDPDLSFEVSRDIAPYIFTKKEQGQYDGTVITVKISPDKKREFPLFSIEAYPRDMAGNLTEPQLVKIGETENYIYFVRDLKSPENISNDILIDGEVRKNGMISSIHIGSINPTFTSLEDQKVISLINEATKKYWYVMSGGKMPKGQIKTISIDDAEYRYLGSDLDTNRKFMDYLSDVYTSDTIQTFKNRMKIFEYFGRMVQPNADVGSMMNYQLAKVIQKKDNGTEKEFDIKVPLGNSFNSEVIHIGFQKTENGWKIFSEPGTF